MGENVKRLGNTLSGRMQKTAKANTPMTLELGTINTDLSLTTDSLRGSISAKDYMVDLRLTHSSYNTSSTTHSHTGGNHSGHESGNGSHTHDGGNHNHRSPSVFRRLRAGDRVLVAWVGHEPVIVSIVVSGDTTTD